MERWKSSLSAVIPFSFRVGGRVFSGLIWIQNFPKDGKWAIEGEKKDKSSRRVFNWTLIFFFQTLLPGPERESKGKKKKKNIHEEAFSVFTFRPTKSLARFILVSEISLGTMPSLFALLFHLCYVFIYELFFSSSSLSSIRNSHHGELQKKNIISQFHSSFFFIIQIDYFPPTPIWDCVRTLFVVTDALRSTISIWIFQTYTRTDRRASERATKRVCREKYIKEY